MQLFSFNPNYKTEDGVFLVEIDMNNLTQEKPKAKNRWVSKDITYNKIKVYNTITKKLSTKSLYIHKDKRLYFKGGSFYFCNTQPKYFIKDLIEL